MCCTEDCGSRGHGWGRKYRFSWSPQDRALRFKCKNSFKIILENLWWASAKCWDETSQETWYDTELKWYRVAGELHLYRKDICFFHGPSRIHFNVARRFYQYFYPNIVFLHIWSAWYWILKLYLLTFKTVFIGTKNQGRRQFLRPTN